MIKIDVISDTICPWCFIGKRNFDKAISLVPDIDVKFTYSTFQLNPDFPKEGVNKKEYISRKFNENHHSTMKERIKNEALKSGISIINSKLDIIPKTCIEFGAYENSKKNFTNIINIKDKKNIIYADKAHHDKDKTFKEDLEGKLSFKDDSFDNVIIFNVLEHVFNFNNCYCH